MPIDKAEYWRERSDYDLVVAASLYEAGHWLYVGFMCHQSIEKALKAYWCATKPDDVPYIHNLIKLAQSCGLTNKLSAEQQALVAELMPLNIEARYPDYKERAANALNQETCKQLLEQTQIFQQWILSKL